MNPSILLRLLGQTTVQHSLTAELPAAIIAYARGALRGIDRLARMITNLMDASRLDQGLFAITQDVIDLTELVRDTVALLHTATNPVEVRAAGPVVLEADGQRVRQALENVISNAQRHSPQGVPVLVELSTEHRDDRAWAVITVQDTGPGIAPDVLPRIFTRFSTGDGKQGLGLGLYLARGITEAHGGRLTVSSTPGKGAGFRFELPLPGNHAA